MPTARHGTAWGLPPGPGQGKTAIFQPDLPSAQTGVTSSLSHPFIRPKVWREFT